MSTRVKWSIPATIQADVQYNHIRLYRSNAEQSAQETSGYELKKEIDIQTGGVYNLYVDDDTTDNGKSKYYYIRFYKSVQLTESDIYLTFFEITPRELRIINQAITFMPTKLQGVLVQEDYRAGMRLAIDHFNVVPPITQYTIDSYPYYGYELFLSLGTAIYTVLYKYLYISFKDFTHSDSGLSFTVARGEKMTAAVDKIMGIYNSLIKPAKMDLMSEIQMGSGLGTFQLPISMGGRISAGLLNVLDIFNHFSA